MAEASASEIARKYPLKAGMSVLLVDAPQGFADRLRAGFAGTAEEDGKGRFDVVQLFVQDAAALRRRLSAAAASVTEGGQLWIAYPKKSSGVATDLTRDEGWDAVAAQGWQAVRQIALDEVWSSLRFKKVEDAEVRGNVDAQYAGAKAALRPIYEKVVALASSIGDDVALSVRQDYVALRRRTHFAAIGPATRTRVDLALKIKGEPATDRLKAHSGLGGGGFTHTVALASVDDVDEEIAGWLRQAYEG